MAAGTTDRRPLPVVALAALLVTGCASSGAEPAADRTALPQGSEPVELDPDDFTVDITNPWWPMEAGDRWVYEESDGKGGVARVEVTVLDRTKTVAAGVKSRIVHDRVTEDGELVEDTYDWYAQDADGNVWYLGEQTAEYENGRVETTEGSWEAGVDGAQAGILLPADPQVGAGYRQEYLAGEAEDAGFVLSTDEQVQVPTGLYEGTLMTRDTTALEPDLVELKFYAPGVGPVMELPISGESGRTVLTESRRAG